jgi:uncharacterized membrane protein YqaE (UPF0057 family)
MFILAILFPPLAVLMTGRLGSFIINLLLCCLLWLPGILHACMVVSNWKAEKRQSALLKAIGGK